MTPRKGLMSRGASVCPKKMLAAAFKDFAVIATTVTTTVTTTTTTITTTTTKTFYRQLLSHNSKEGFDEQRRFSLSQENVSSCVQRFCSCRSNCDAQQPTHLHHNPLKLKINYLLSIFSSRNPIVSR
jgi:hypothetical protein